MNLVWTDIGFWDLWKAIAVALTGMFGIMGLLTNYKDKATGRITVWGRINMVGILLSATMGVLSQLIETQNKIISAQRSAAEANMSAGLALQTSMQAQVAATQAKAAASNTAQLIGDLLAVSRKTAAIARGTERSVANSQSAANAGKEAASRTLMVARGTAEAVGASKAGLVRIERLLSPFESPTLVLLIQPNTWLDNPCPTKRNGQTWLSISSADKKQQTQIAQYEGDKDWRLHSTPGINICEMSIPLSATINAGIYSYLDLPAKIFTLSIEIDPNIYHLTGAKIKTKDGQQVVIPLADSKVERGNAFEGSSPSWLVTYAFPLRRDPRSAIQW